MASNLFTSDRLTVEDKSTRLYKWMTDRPDSSSTELLQEVYDEQASYYDELLCDKMGWYGWKEGSEFFNGQLEKFGFSKGIRILDAGAGTGLVGKRLSELGYTNITALDISHKMLIQCKEEGCYKEFHQCDLNIDSLDAYNKAFDAVIAIGIFSKALVLPQGMKTLHNCVKKGGLVCISSRSKHFENFGHKAMTEEMVAKGFWKNIGRQDTDNYFTGQISGHYLTFQVQ
ncbi:hypothetical protein LOD99_14725 [Oopsacas minuta]|uniref:Methyltransferase domain-containing protein n=1 Tax=Oopsacas minuta TaxID=111878 RepID=A0AAV7KEK0_9METZ|nr:hypothetical protein LOD99_14725 [Oopsacas minuta]